MSKSLTDDSIPTAPIVTAEPLANSAPEQIDTPNFGATHTVKSYNSQPKAQKFEPQRAQLTLQDGTPLYDAHGNPIYAAQAQRVVQVAPAPQVTVVQRSYNYDRERELEADCIACATCLSCCALFTALAN